MTLRSARDLLLKRVEDFQWLRIPGPLPMEHYEETIRSLSERAHDISGIIGMYDLGPVRYPGLSDLDVVFVVEDEFSDFESLRPLLRAAQPPLAHDVLLHDPYFIRRSELPRFIQFAPIFQYRAVWTAPGLPAAGTVQDAADILLFLMDIIAESYPREFIQFLLAPVLDERTLLSRLKGLAYCFDLLERLTGRSEPDFAAYAAAITTLRASFFTIPEKERAHRLLALTRDAVMLSEQLARKTAAYLAENYNLDVAGNLALFCAGSPAIYSNAVAPEPRFGAIRLRRTEVFAVAPAVFGWLVREYSTVDGPFSARLRTRMIDHVRVLSAPSDAFIKTIRRRAALRNAHTAWADASGLGLSTFLTFGYRVRRRLPPPAALKEAAARLAERARESLLRRAMSRAV